MDSLNDMTLAQLDPEISFRVQSFRPRAPS